MHPFVRKAGTARMRRFAGFTLVELIVVITILAILATIGFLALSGYSQDAKSSVILANVRSINSAISIESTTSGNSPRYYVIHDTGAALSGAIVYVDGAPLTLTGGDWNVPNTNYSAGNPDYVKLRLNPEKFKISINGLPGGTIGLIARAFQGGIGFPMEADAAYDYKGLLSVGAMEASESSSSGRRRAVTYFQVAGIEPSTKKIDVTGNFPTALSGSVGGLVKDPSISSATGSLINGNVLGTVNTNCTSNCPVDIGIPTQFTYGVTGPTTTFSSTTRAPSRFAAFTNVGINQGKWYFEATIDDNYNSGVSGVYDIGFSNKPNTYSGSTWFAEQTILDNFGAYVHPGSGVFCSYTHCGTNMVNAGGVITSFTTWGMGDVIGVAVDATNKTVSWYRNGVLAWTTTGITTPTPWYVGVSSTYTPTATGIRFNFGQSAFQGTVPTGYGPGVGTLAQ